MFFTDLDSMQQTLEFFECLAIDSNQNPAGIFDAMLATFQKPDFSSLLQKKIFFLFSEGASINGWHKSGLISLLYKD